MDDLTHRRFYVLSSGVWGVSALLGEAPSEDHEGSINPRLAEVERALYTYRSLALVDHRQPPTPDELGERISAAKQAWYLSPNKYSDALRVLRT